MKTKPTPKPTAQTTITDGTRQWIATKSIDPHPHNRQITPESCRGLADSMRSHGQIQPVTVRPHPTKPDRYQLGAGARRWHAAKLAGLSLDCIVRDLSDAEIEAMLAIENLQRENPEPREEAAQIRRLTELPGSTPESIAAMLGRPDSWVKRRMRLCALTDSIHTAWQDPESSIHNLPIATMELVAALSPELQEHFHSEWVVDGYESPSHSEVVSWLSSLSCSLKDAKWLDNPATFIEGCGPSGCATSSVASDLFSNTEFADAKVTKCAQCLNPACFNKRKNLARDAEWQAAIAKAPKGYYAISASYDPDPVTLADGSTLKLRNQWNFHNWKTSKKSDPVAEPFLEEENGKVKLTWKIAPEPTGPNSKPLPKPSSQDGIKDPAEAIHASITRLQGKRYSLVLDDLRLHLDACKFGHLGLGTDSLLILATSFGTDSNANSVNPKTWDEFHQLQNQDLKTTIDALWDSVCNVIIRRLRDRAHTERQSDIASPAFIAEMTHISTLTKFDLPAAYVRAATGSKLPGSLKHLDPITLQPK
jgi:ParB/RepB/Spo0J family partition protein